MTRLLLKVSIICLVVLIDYVTEGTGVHAASSPSLTATDQIPVYEKFGQEIIPIGKLLKGNSYSIVNEDDLFYYLPFGNGMGLVKKSADFVLTNTNKKEPVPSKYTNKVVITKTETAVYDGQNKNKQALGIISMNMRYPVIKKMGDWYFIKFAGKQGYIHHKNVVEDLGIPVLMYHHLLEEIEDTPFEGNSMVIKVSSFEEQMEYLMNNGWKTISLTDLDHYLQHKKNLTGRVVAITFDDNYLSMQRYAYPILKGNDQQATSFVIGGKTWRFASPWDSSGLQYLGFQEMSTMKDVFEYQHHTVRMHLREPGSRIPYLISKSEQEIIDDLLYGKQYIGKVYNNPSAIKYLAYPFGQYDQETIVAAQKAGIRMAFTTETGNVKLGDHRYKLKRQGIGPYHSMEDFIEKLNGTY
ncbi:polysaccharide deacetylase family protein [Peribacillus acanthi]|uniref:polysaccharide deacetylase family protein n=1 Tax=Peribacillus acanthi TaxID=2171554 RepID=UPI000D3E8B0E|nr:polysaccharide deacetylase family protein [Peribacillus acanthi]